jgi:hypothetical protein
MSRMSLLQSRSTLRNVPGATSRRVLATALLAAAATAGCDPGDDSLEQTSQELTVPANKEIYAGHYVRRQSRAACEHSCAKFVDSYETKPSGQRVKVHRCTKYNNDCIGYTANGLYDAPGSSTLVAGLPDFPDDPSIMKTFYVGCGPKAAQNVMGYFGISEPITGIPSPPYYVKTTRTDQLSLFFQNGIATTPDNLASGLQRALNDMGDGTFKVTRKSGVDMMGEVKKSIDAGFPIIVLADNGAHFLMVTGYNLHTQTMIVNDYAFDNDKVQPARAVDLGDPLLNFETHFSFGYHPGGWEDRTVITVERTGAAPTSGFFKPSNSLAVYSLNGTVACHVTWDQYLALHQPGYKTITPHEADNFAKSYGGSTTCKNGETGLPPYDKGLFKASDNPAVYSLNGTHACWLTWEQYLALGQPGFNTISPTDMTKFKAAYGGGATCTNKEVGL